jgi:hypothetical protein
VTSEYTDRTPLQCWKCGADLKSVPRPFSRFAECPGCKVDLHVCRMCRHYDRRYVGQCNHDFADKVLEKEKSNFCGHFKPSDSAYEGGGEPEKEKAQQQLDSLFGNNDEPDTDPDSLPEPESEAEVAKKKLNDLFDD